MNRRSYLKSIFLLGTVSVTSFSIFKWFDLNKTVLPSQLTDKRKVIAELAELIIPATDTPGAKDAMVHDYIINVIINCNPVRQQRKFLSGIEELEGYALNRYGKDFLKCNSLEMHSVLDYSAKNASYPFEILNKINRKILGDSFYVKLRELTIEGYCLSEAGATKGLAYDYIPGTFEACIPLAPNQKSWATK